MPELIGVGDLAVQRGVPLLRDPRGAADLDGGVAAQPFPRRVRVGAGRLAGRRGFRRTRRHRATVTFSRRFYPKTLTIRTFVRRKINNMWLSGQ